MSRSFALRLYALTTGALAPLIPQWLDARARRGKEDPARLGERLGRAGLPRPMGPLVWLHAVSVGESLSLLALIERFGAERPDLSILVTTGTRAAAEVLVDRLPPGALHQYAPVDTPGAAARFLLHWRPALAVFVESELWPNLILDAKARGVRLALVSAGMSATSFAGWRRVPAAARTVLTAFDLVLARDEGSARRLRVLGARVDGLADLKFGAASLPVDDQDVAAFRDALDGRPVILVASTHEGEDAPVMDGFANLARGPLLVIVPRHPRRGGDIAALATARGLRVGRRSQGDGPEDLDVCVADTLGELGLWYSLARLAVIGGSLVRRVGGHNPLEAARLDCPFVAGPHVEKWPVYDALIAARATCRITAGDLSAVFADAMRDDADLPAMAVRARQFVADGDVAARVAMTRVLALAPR